MATDTLITLATILAAGIGGPTILLTVMNSRFADINNRFADVNNRIVDINKRVDGRFAAQTELMRQGFDNVNRRLDERLDDVNSRFDDLNKRIDDLNNRFDDVNNRLDDVNNRFDDVNSRLDNVNNRLDDHGLRLARIEDGYIDIGQRVSRLEGRIGLYPPPAAEPEVAAALPTES